MPSVSILTATYNRSSFLNEAILSALSQDFTDFELIIIDDGSTDDTRDIVRSFSDQRIRYFHQSNRGQTTALNAGLSSATGEFLTFLDSDDLFLPHKLSAQVRELEQDPEIGLTAGGWIRIDELGRALSTVTPLNSHDLDLQNWLLGCPIITCSVLLRTEWARIAGGFDSSFAAYNDWDLWLRMVTAGCTMRWGTEIVCKQRFHPGNTYYPAYPVSPAIEKYFATSPSVPMEIRARENWYLARAHLVKAVQVIAKSQMEDGQSLFGKAFELYPNWLGSEAPEALQIVTGTIKAQITADLVIGRPSREVWPLANDVLCRLPEALTNDPRRNREFKVLLARGLLYDALESDDQQSVRREVLRILQLDPTWLRTKGALSMCVQAVVHPRRVKALRRQLSRFA
ncbi:MAG: glycosyltransferase [Chloroflexota bacterium]